MFDVFLTIVSVIPAIDQSALNVYAQNKIDRTIYLVSVLENSIFNQLHDTHKMRDKKEIIPKFNEIMVTL